MENSLNPDEPDDLEYLSSATLTRRKDFIDHEEEARNAPNRVLYFRRNADCDRLIEVSQTSRQPDTALSRCRFSLVGRGQHR